MNQQNLQCEWKFTGVPGFTFDFGAKFKGDPAFKATTLPSLGLNENFVRLQDFHPHVEDSGQKLKPWELIKLYLQKLNTEGRGAIKYKVLYITRHGLGFHNTFEAQVGREAWNNHWSHLDGDGTVVWADSKLNERGQEQVLELGKFWSRIISEERVPFPGSIYTSPLTRCLQTTDAVFRNVFEQLNVPFNPVIKELLRERLTDHTCDRRSSRKYIAENFPGYVIEPGFSEIDELWTGGKWETEGEHVGRKQAVLDDIFTNDDNSFIALTTHSYAVSAILTVLDMQPFRVREGSSIAILVKAEQVNGL